MKNNQNQNLTKNYKFVHKLFSKRIFDVLISGLKFYAMITIKVKFRSSTVAGSCGTIYYQITYRREVRQLSTDYHIFVSEWNQKKSVINVSGNTVRSMYLKSMQERVNIDVKKLGCISYRLEMSMMPYRVDDVISEFNRWQNDCYLFKFMGGIITKLKRSGKFRTAETYRATLLSFRRFLTETSAVDLLAFRNDILIDCIDSNLMEEYEAWHHNRGNMANTISFYARVLRAVYNRAVRLKLIDNQYPFRGIYTGVSKTVKRALPLGVIRKIKKLDLIGESNLEFARDMFMLSFYLRGMSFIDMAFLKKNNLKNGYVTYNRRKTGQRLVIKWTAEMQQICDKYPPNETEYLLPIIKFKDVNERAVYKYVNFVVNRSLKTIAKRLDIVVPLTMYVARHSWASIARNSGVPIGVISEGMGHESETTTRIYLASLDNSMIDKANSLVISLV